MSHDLSEKTSFVVKVEPLGTERNITVEHEGKTLSRTVKGLEHGSWTDFFAAAADLFGTRRPVNRTIREFPPDNPQVVPLLTQDEPTSEKILYGYGDPWVLREGDGYYLIVTSNDAPDVFPILKSADLRRWTFARAAFPADEPWSKPAWAIDAPGSADFWAPEVHKIGDRFILCFSARERNDKTMAIGLAQASSPAGPYELISSEPLRRGNVIDSHLFVDVDGSVYLFWKVDNNDLWPRLLICLFERRPQFVEEVFRREEDRKTVRLLLGLWPAAQHWEPIERFFVLQIMIEAARPDYASVITRLEELASVQPELADVVQQVVEAMYTPVHGCRLNPETLSFDGKPFEVIKNDKEWEGHLIEGMCMTRQNGRYFLFYSGNDFSTPEYGIGYAVAAKPSGPFHKPVSQPIVTSTTSWWGPGHPSVAAGLDGEPVLFMHAYRRGNAGYKAFRAVLAAGLDFTGDQVLLTTLKRPAD